MQHLGLDVHSRSTTACLLDGEGQVRRQTRVATTAPELQALIEPIRAEGPVEVGQEVGTLSYFVHDVVTALGVRILSFNAQQLRMIASSRKKTDRRDAYWIAKALQTGMTPHVVYIPDRPIRELRRWLSRREAVAAERRRWMQRARCYLRMAGYGTCVPKTAVSVERLIARSVAQPDGLDEDVAESLELCRRQEEALRAELKQLDATVATATRGLGALARLKTIPAVADRVALAIYAWVGDVHRFPDARSLTAYAGLVPSVWSSAEVTRMGGITRLGSPLLRKMLVQAGHSLLSKCRPEKAGPLKAIAARIQTHRRRYKIAVVAAARLILRIAYYVLRDGTSYDPTRLRLPEATQPVS
jgi:transposase